MGIKTQQHELLGTSISISLDEQFTSFFSLCFDELKRIEQTYSRFLDTSLLASVNSKLGVWQKVPKEFFSLVKIALEVQSKTKGYFDITLKKELERIGYDKEYSFVEKEKEKQSLISKVRDRFTKPVEFKESSHEILLRKEIEFGGLGKGFAVDCVAKLLHKNKVPRFLINAGGDIYCYANDKKQQWELFLEHPTDNTKVFGKIYLSKGALASSSPSRRKWKDKHHLLNPKSKQPAQDISAIWIQHENCVHADAYATALFVCSYDTAVQICERENICAYILSSTGEVYVGKGFRLEEI